jgi:hypothetical protein
MCTALFPFPLPPPPHASQCAPRHGAVSRRPPMNESDDWSFGRYGAFSTQPRHRMQYSTLGCPPPSSNHSTHPSQIPLFFCGGRRHVLAQEQVHGGAVSAYGDHERLLPAHHRAVPIRQRHKLGGALLCRHGHGDRVLEGKNARRPPNPSNTTVARTECYTYAANVWALSVVQGPFSVAPRQTLIRFASTNPCMHR